MTLRLYAAVPLSKTLTESPDSIDLEIELLLAEGGVLGTRRAH